MRNLVRTPLFDLRVMASLLIGVALLNPLSTFARLGDTRDQAEARYGLPKSEKPPKFGYELIQGAKELTFEYQGWKIRCALLLATDGKEYIVREEYRKIWNSEVMKKGGSIRISDQERDAILRAEAGTGTWHSKLIGEIDRDPVITLGNQIAHIAGITGKVWVTEAGAVARLSFGADSMILDLPQARKYEAELKTIKEQKDRAAIPQF